MVAEMLQLIDWTQPSLYLSAACIIFNPLAWNIVARREYRGKFISKRIGRDMGWKMLALAIFSMGHVRTYLFSLAMADQPTWSALDSPLVDLLSWVIFAAGGILVLGSYYRLGIKHTYLADYFGYLMDERVTAFPFNILDNPMYWGSTLEYLSMALGMHSAAGLFLTLVVYVVYYVAIQFEGPFTSMIYANREKDRAKRTD